MRKYQFFALGAIAALLIGAGCAKKAANTNAENANSALFEDVNVTVNGNVPATDEGASANTNAAVNTNVPANTNASVDQGTGGESTNENANVSVANDIIVSSPDKNDELASPFYVEGKATGDLVYVRVISLGGVAIFTEKVSVKDGKFRGKLLFDFSTTTKGYIEAFRKDADGNEVGLVRVPVQFKVQPTATNENSNANTNSSDDGASNENVNTNESANVNSGY